jgi:ankyrin repeat protein
MSSSPTKNQIKKLFRLAQAQDAQDGPTKLETTLAHLTTQHHIPNTKTFVRTIRNNQETLLHRACAHGAFAIAQHLVAEYFAPDLLDVRNQQVKTPLHCACTVGSADIVQLLLAHGALIDAHRTHSWTPLMYAVSRNHVHVVQLFMQYVRHHQEPTSQHDASTTTPRSTPLYLDLNQINQDGMTALYLASRENSVACVQLLLQHHADPNITSKTNRSPLHVAVKYQNEAIVDLLLAVSSIDLHTIDSSRSTLLHTAAAVNSVSMVRRLDDRGCVAPMLLHKDVCGRHPLHIAALEGSVEVAALLIQAFTRLHCGPTVTLLSFVDGKDDEENTPLALAASRGHVGVVAALLGHGVDVNVRCKYLYICCV